MKTLIIGYIIIINLIAFLTMYVDKQKAIHKKWRIPEFRLFLLAFILGSPGILFGMYVFRHKTKHMKFVIGIPAILIAEILIYIFI